MKKNDRITEHEGVCSSMPKTRSNQGIEEKGGYRSNVSKTIAKQGLEGGLVYCANVPMAIGKSDFEGGVANCAHKWKTYDRCKSKSVGRVPAENKHQDCGAHHRQVNVGVVLIHQCHQQIIR